MQATQTLERWLSLRRFLRLYLLTGFATLALLVGNGVLNGGLERHHDLRHWIMLLGLYAAFAAFWPVLLGAALLNYFGLLHAPIEF